MTEIIKVTKITCATVFQFRKKALQHEYNSENLKILLTLYIKDASHFGKFKHADIKFEKKLLMSIQKDRNSHEKSLHILSQELS